MASNQCASCRRLQEAIGKAEVRAAEAEARLGRERKWWRGWMLATFFVAGFSIYLLYSFELKKWLWYDFLLPARRPAQTTSAPPLQQQQPIRPQPGSDSPSQGRAPAGQPRPQQTPVQQRRPEQR